MNEWTGGDLKEPPVKLISSKDKFSTLMQPIFTYLLFLRHDWSGYTLYGGGYYQIQRIMYSSSLAIFD